MPLGWGSRKVNWQNCHLAVVNNARPNKKPSHLLNQFRFELANQGTPSKGKAIEMHSHVEESAREHLHTQFIIQIYYNVSNNSINNKTPIQSCWPFPFRTGAILSVHIYLRTTSACLVIPLCIGSTFVCVLLIAMNILCLQSSIYARIIRIQTWILIFYTATVVRTHGIRSTFFVPAWKITSASSPLKVTESKTL